MSEYQEFKKLGLPITSQKLDLVMPQNMVDQIISNQMLSSMQNVDYCWDPAF
jgi:hypothetical protein